MERFKLYVVLKVSVACCFPHMGCVRPSFIPSPAGVGREGTPKKVGWGCAAHFPTPLPYS